MNQYRGDDTSTRPLRGLCKRCGEFAPTRGLICDHCWTRDYDTQKRYRQRQLNEQHRLTAAAEERRLRQCREIVVAGITYVVVNSYDTESSGDRIQKSIGPWSTRTKSWSTKGNQAAMSRRPSVL